MNETQLLTSFYDENGKINYQQLAAIAATDCGRAAAYPELDEEEKLESVGGNLRAIESALILRGDRQTNSAEYRGKKITEIASRQESLLTAYAQENKCWLQENEISNNALRQLPSGEESHVYLENDTRHVIKFVNYRVMNESPQEFLTNRIVLNNYITPDTKLQLVGFTKNDVGFAFVVKQHFVHGEMLAEQNSRQIPSDKQDLLDAYMAEHFRMKRLGTTFYNQEYILDDVHGGNVLQTPSSDFKLIDVVPSLNSEEDDLDGVR